MSRYHSDCPPGGQWLLDSSASTSHRVSRQAYDPWRHRKDRSEDPEHLVLVSELRAIWEAVNGTAARCARSSTARPWCASATAWSPIPHVTGARGGTSEGSARTRLVRRRSRRSVAGSRVGDRSACGAHRSASVYIVWCGSSERVPAGRSCGTSEEGRLEFVCGDPGGGPAKPGVALDRCLACNAGEPDCASVT